MPGGADHLAHIYGTEEDKVHCPFYLKVGACRHGDRCSRQHIQPLHAPTICLPHMFDNPMAAMAQQSAFGGAGAGPMDPRKLEDEFIDFYIDVYEELSQYGEIDELVVVENLCDHLVGNVMCRYFDEEDADLARRSLNGRWYGGKQLACEFSPVSDFRDARCRQHDENKCRFKGQCNFLHLRLLPRDLIYQLNKNQPKLGERSEELRERERGRDRDRDRRPDDRDRRRDYDSRDRHRDHRRDYDRDRHRDRDHDRHRERRYRSRSPARRRDREEEGGHRAAAGAAAASAAAVANGS